jgi:nucleotide-binding universal stress UspA family protein
MQSTGPSPVPRRFERILVASDLGARSDRAVDRARQLADAWQVPLLVVHVMPRTPGSPEPVRQRVERELRRAVPAAAIHVLEGEPADAILELAAREGCDLIVLGDGGGSPAQPVAGSTTQALARKAPCSLLVVKRRPQGPYQRVLVGTDLTEESRHGLETAAALFPLARLTLLHALDIPYASLWLAPDRRGELLRMEHATIEAFADEAKLDPAMRARLELVVEHGHPEIMLGDRALEQEDDLVVIGAYRRGIAFHVLLGGTTRRIVQVAPSDVLVVRLR